jgi:hypothetical protein
MKAVESSPIRQPLVTAESRKAKSAECGAARLIASLRSAWYSEPKISPFFVFWLETAKPGLKAEALHLADRTADAL